MTVYATRLANSQDTAARMRRADGMAYTPSGAAGLARSGLRPDGGGAVSITSGTMTVTAQPFAAWVDGTTSDAQGGYPFISDSAVNMTVAAGHATLARVDTVVAQVRETAVDGSGSTDARVYLLQGTPGSGAPALPASTIALRDINVPAGASAGTGGLTAANLGADRRTYVAAIGGVLPVATQAERDALPSPQQGASIVFRLDTQQVEVRTASGWVSLNPNPTWTAIPLASGFQTRAATGATPQYRVFPDGRVELRGHVERTPAAAIGSGGVTFATLPAGARPSIDRVLSTGTARASSSTPSASRLDVATTGVMVINMSDTSGTWLSLDGVLFYLS